MDEYLGSTRVTLETQTGDGGFVCHGDPGGSARVPQVILVDLALGRSDYKAGAVHCEVHRGERTFHPNGSQDALTQNPTASTKAKKKT